MTEVLMMIEVVEKGNIDIFARPMMKGKFDSHDQGSMDEHERFDEGGE
jgi:hypothetical protein